MRNACEILGLKPEGERPLERPMHKLEWILGKRWEDVEWMHLAQDRDQWRALVNTAMNLWVPHKVGNFLTS
jgi:hypothetical protein